MNAIHPISRTDESVTLRAADFDALIGALEDAEDIAALLAAGAREEAMGKVGLRADNLSDALVGRLLEGEHPVRIWREHRGMTMATLADAAGVSRSYLAEIEAGRKPGSVAAYRSLAEALRLTLDDIVPENTEAHADA